MIICHGTENQMDTNVIQLPTHLFTCDEARRRKSPSSATWNGWVVDPSPRQDGRKTNTITRTRNLMKNLSSIILASGQRNWVFVKLPSFLPWFFLSSLPTTPTPNKSIHTTHPSIYWRCITCYRNIIISAALLRVITITGSHSLSPSCNLTPPHNGRGESAEVKNGDSQQFPFDIRSWFVVADDMVGVHRCLLPQYCNHVRWLDKGGDDFYNTSVVL